MNSLKNKNKHKNKRGKPVISIPINYIIRHKSGAESLHIDCEERKEVLQLFVNSIIGTYNSYNNEIFNKDDLKPGIVASKCLSILCLLQPEFSVLICTEMQEHDENYWFPLVRAISKPIALYTTINEANNELTVTKTRDNNGNNGKTGIVNIKERILVSDMVGNFIFGILTLILTIIDCFEIDDRMEERELLKELDFEIILWDLERLMPRLNGLIELYRQQALADLKETQFVDSELTDEFLGYLRDRAAQHGWLDYLTNILTNLAALPAIHETYVQNIYITQTKYKIQNVKYKVIAYFII